VGQVSTDGAESKRENVKTGARILLILIAGVGGLNLAQAQPLPIRMGYSVLGSAISPVWMAKELGLFERHGVYSGPVYMAQTVAYRAMLAGETDVTGGGGIAPIQARLGGADTIVLLTYINGFGFSLMARPPIQQPGDLKGKLIGVTRFGTPTDLAAQIALKRWKLIPGKDVAIIQLGGDPERFAALKAGTVQATILGPPFSTELKRLGMIELLDFSQTDIDFTGLGLTSTARYVNAHGEATRRVVRAFVEVIWAFKANRESALRAMEKFTRLADRKLLEDAYESNRKVFRLMPRTTEGGIRNILDALADQNPRARGANPQDFYTNRFVDELEKTGFMRELAVRYPAALR
jgi:NitT/TauT family transport system substrate-binding protein